MLDRRSFHFAFLSCVLIIAASNSAGSAVVYQELEDLHARALDDQAKDRLFLLMERASTTSDKGLEQQILGCPADAGNSKIARLFWVSKEECYLRNIRPEIGPHLAELSLDEKSRIWASCGLTTTADHVFRFHDCYVRRLMGHLRGSRPNGD